MSIYAPRGTYPTKAAMLCSDAYRVTDDGLDPQGQTYSREELEELLFEQGIEVRELPDGRVVDYEWDPASNESPWIYAVTVDTDE